MFPATIGAGTPLGLAAKALINITTIASEGKGRSFAETVGTAQAEGAGAKAAGPGGSSPALVGTTELQPHNGAPLPPPPAVSQQPIPPTVEGIQQLYATMRELR